LLGGGVSEGDQAATVAEQCIGALGDVAELLPAPRGFGVEGRGIGVVAVVLGELGAGGAERVLVEWVAGLDPIGEPASPAASAFRSMSASCLW
jgi:hypothetical protein